MCVLLCVWRGGAEVVASSKVNAEILSHTPPCFFFVFLPQRGRCKDIQTNTHTHTRAHTIGSKQSSVFELKAIFSASLGRTMSFSQRRCSLPSLQNWSDEAHVLSHMLDKVKGNGLKIAALSCWTMYSLFSMSTSCFYISYHIKILKDLRKLQNMTKNSSVHIVIAHQHPTFVIKLQAG